MFYDVEFDQALTDDKFRSFMRGQVALMAAVQGAKTSESSQLNVGRARRRPAKRGSMRRVDHSGSGNRRSSKERPEAVSA